MNSGGKRIVEPLPGCRSSMVAEVIKTFFFFLRENFASIKSIKSKKNIKSVKNIYKRISDFLKHKTLNKRLSLRCSL